MAGPFPHLFRPLAIRGVTIRNRILSTGHDTTLPTDGRVNEALVEYHRARAKGGAGLIVTQVAWVHETARYTSHLLMATDDGCIEGYRRLAAACHAEGCAVFSQLFHPGREIADFNAHFHPPGGHTPDRRGTRRHRQRCWQYG